ncbi:MAG: segregation/condensation protein A [Pyrinomonadaceae bacterium]|nr:segregation/condensation protein A [Phycisphaerales bacterium]
MTHAADYRVKLDAFEGPMDLLLFLIRRAEVEVTDIPIASITDQYMVYLREGGVESIDIEKAGEFLVMAATLMEVKSRMLIPSSATDSEPSGPDIATSPRDDGGGLIDPRTDLIRQLLAYKKFRDAASELNHRLHEWESRYPTARVGYDAKQVSEAVSEMADIDIDDLELVDLLAAFTRIVDTVDMDRVGEHLVVMDDTPIELHAADLLDKIQRETSRVLPSGDAPSAAPAARREIEFASIFAGRTRSEMIGLFLAMLELVRQRKVVVRQDPDQQQIMLSIRVDDEADREENANI